MDKDNDRARLLLFTYPVGILIGASLRLGELLRAVEVSGWSNFPSGQSKLLVVSNHPSLLEPIILPGLFFPQYLRRPFEYAPYSIAEVKNFGGWLFSLVRSRLIFIERGRKGSAKRALEQAADVLNANKPVIFFGEGGRTSSSKEFLLSEKGERIRPFKPGMAWLVENTKATVLPVWVSGTDRVFPNGEKVTFCRFPRFWNRVTIRLGQPLNFNGEDRDTITHTVERAILALADQNN